MPMLGKYVKMTVCLVGILLVMICSGLVDRGYVRLGMWADLVVLDLDAYRDRATMEDPHQFAEGAVHVLVNGAFSIRDGAVVGTLAGRPLRAPGVHAGG